MTHILVPSPMELFESATLRLFICYSNLDSDYKDALLDIFHDVCRIHSLEHPKEIAFWHDRDIAKGEPWLPELKLAIHNSNSAIALISDNWLNSDFIQNKEINLLEAKENEEQYFIIPIVVTNCEWKSHPFLRKRQAAVVQFDPKDEFIDKNILKEMIGILVVHLKKKISDKRRVIEARLLAQIEQQRMELALARRRSLIRNFLFSICFFCITISMLAGIDFLSNFGDLLADRSSVGTEEIRVSSSSNLQNGNDISLHLLQISSQLNANVAIDDRPFYFSFEDLFWKDGKYIGQPLGSGLYAFLTPETTRIRIYNDQDKVLRTDELKVLKRSDLSIIRIKFGSASSLAAIALCLFFRTAKLVFKTKFDLD